MLEDIKNKFMLPKFADPVPGTLKEILDNGTTTRDNVLLNGLGTKKGKSGGVSMMPKTGMEVAQDYTVFKYGPPRPKKDVKYQDRTTV